MEKSFSYGVVIRDKMRNCNKYTKEFSCDGSDELVNQKQDFSSNLNELKTQPPDECGHMLPCYKTI